MLARQQQRRTDPLEWLSIRPCCGTEAGLYLRLIDFSITQLKAQGPSRTCNESKEEEEDLVEGFRPPRQGMSASFIHTRSKSV